MSSYLSPLGWEHINLSGDYLWPALSKARAGELRPVRPAASPLRAIYFIFPQDPFLRKNHSAGANLQNPAVAVASVWI